MPRGWALSLAVAVAATCACAAQPPVQVRVLGDGGREHCAAEIEGQRIDPETLALTARRWRNREAHIRGSVETPYRCVGAVIDALQRAGLSRIGFVSEPALEEKE